MDSWQQTRICCCGECRYHPSHTVCPARQYPENDILELALNPDAEELYVREYEEEWAAG